MYLSGIGTAVPARRYTKAECWDAFADSAWFGRLNARSHAIATAVLRRDNGIEARRLAVDTLAEVFAIDPDTLHQRFATHAPRLVDAAAREALARSGLDPGAIDALVVSTCTGYLCPALSGYAIESLGLRGDVRAFDLVGQGCAGALPNWQVASALVGSDQAAHVLSVCVEVCSAAMYLEDDPGVLISACLFGDGAGAAVLSAAPRDGARRVRWHASTSRTDPAEREALRFQQRGGMFRNVLTRAVPRLAADAAHAVYRDTLAREGLADAAIAAWILHAGGRDVLLAVERRFGLAPDALRLSAATLREYGNLSSAFVYFVLDAALRARSPGGWWWMTSFGAGFSCHGALLEVE